MSSYGLGRPTSGNYYSPRSSYGTPSSYGQYRTSHSKPSYTPSSSRYGSSSYLNQREPEAGGYTSDYGKTDYTSDYGRSGYRTGYTSDAKPSSVSSKPTSYAYGRSISRQNSITDRLSRQNSLTSNENLSRKNSVNSINGVLSRHNSITDRSDFNRNSFDNSNYGRYSSREEVSSNSNGLNHSGSKSRVNCKAPADFTTDESEESEEEESDEDEKLLVTRSTSPDRDGSGVTSKIALMKEERIKRDQNNNRSTIETSSQVVSEDFPPKRERFISSRPTSLYLNKYYPSPSPRLPKQQLSVEEPVSAGGFSRDASPNARPEEPNKDFRKSVLNMNVDDRLRDEYGRRQEEMRRRRHVSSESSGTPSSSSGEENHLLEPDQEVRKRKVLKKSPSRSGISLLS